MDAKKINNHNITSSDEAIKIIESIAKAVIADPSESANLPAVMLRGAPGIGKTTIVKEIAHRLGISFKVVLLSQMERVDICGLPSVNDNVTAWNVPGMWPRDKDSKGILLLDEITSAPSDVQVAAYQLVLDRCISNSNYKLPDGWVVIAAGNRTIDRAVVKTMSSALANRFLHIEMEPNAEDWIAWAIPHDIDPAVTGFISFRPGLLSKMDDQNLEAGWPSPRSWERVSHVIKLFRNDEDTLRKTVYGLVGPGAGVEFMAFYKTQSKFENVVDIMTNPKKEVVIPTKSDEKCAFISAASYLLWNGKSEEDDKVRVEGLYRIVDKLTPDFAVMMVKMAVLGNGRVSKGEAIKKISASPSYKDFVAKHAKALANRGTAL